MIFDFYCTFCGKTTTVYICSAIYYVSRLSNKKVHHLTSLQMTRKYIVILQYKNKHRQ